MKQTNHRNLSRVGRLKNNTEQTYGFFMNSHAKNPTVFCGIVCLIPMLGGRFSNVLLLQFTAGLCFKKNEKWRKWFSTGINKST
jgi:hypothetical protein